MPKTRIDLLLILQLLFCSLCLPQIAQSQKEASLLPFAETANYKIEALSLPGGRAANTVNCIVQGPNDFLWIASHDGLHRYDGYEVITYKQSEKDTLERLNSFNFSYVENLYWDRFDKLWVCTYGGGLYRFDPQTEHFKQYSHDQNDPNSISSDRVMCVAEDAAGDLWFGTEEGLNRFQRESETFERFLPDATREGSLSHPNVRNIYLDRQGTLWIGTGVVHWVPDEGGLNRFDPATNSFTHYTYDPDDPNSLWTNAVQGLLEDSRGDFWVTTTGGLQKMDRQNGRFERMPYHPDRPHAPGAKVRGSPSAWSLLEDRDGGLWVGTIGDYDYPFHLLRYDPVTHSVEEFPVRTAAWHLFETRDGTIWVSDAGEGQGNVLKFTPKEKSYHWHQSTDIFDDFKKTDLYRKLSFGPAENDWFGPVSLAFDPKDESMWLSYILRAKQLEDYSPHAILVNYDPNSNQSHFFHLDDLDLKSIVPLANTIDAYYAMGMAVGKDGKIWGSFASDQIGMYCFDPQSGETLNYRHLPDDTNSLLSNRMTFLMMDSEEMVWVAQYEEGLSRLDPKTGKWRHYRADSDSPYQIGGFNPLSILEGKDGRIWTGGLAESNEPFISAIDQEGESTQNYPAPKNFPVYNFPRFLAESGGNIFFSLYVNGLGELSPDLSDSPLFQYTPDENNFPLVGVASVMADLDGKLWIASNLDNRVARLDPDTKKWLVLSNSISDPILDRSGLLGPDGRLYFLHKSKAWSIIDPAAISVPEVDSTRLRLTNLYLADQRQIPTKSKLLPTPIWELDQLNLQQVELPLSLRFSSFHFLSSDVVYQYRLFPYEQDWKKLYNESALTYNYLPLGTYQLQIKAFHKYGLADEEGIKLNLTILPPWWKSWWAYALYFLAFLLLLTGLYLYQRRRWQLQTQLEVEQEKADRLRELDHFKSRFYTNITHEFRTPLTVIKGMAGQIKDEKIKTLIQRNSNRLLQMVNELLDLSKLETNSLNIAWVQGDIIPYLRYLTESCHSLADNKRLKLAFFSKEESIVMDFDENKLQQIVINLLSNAIKFTPEYGRVKVLADRVLENGLPHLKLTVEDTGRGIPADQLPHIFDRFYQVDNSTTREGEGSGIGLALVRELVQLLSGQVEVESELEKGSTFQVYLPIQQKAQQQTNEDWSSKMDTQFPETALVNQVLEAALPALDEKPLVLVIEDNADVTEYIISCLQTDYHLQAARDGRSGLEKALAIIPDVILCDVMMPEMNGFEVCRRLKSDRSTSHIPIIMLTAKATQEDKITGLSQGADAYLTKPFDEEELMVRLRNLATQSKRLREQLANPKSLDESAHPLAQREAEFLQELHEIIETNLSNELFDTQTLCQLIAMSRAQLYRKIKALTNYSTAHYIRQIRLRKAKSLLETTDSPIGEIALQVGFKDFSHFSRSFLKAFGMRPSEVRV